MKIFFHEDKIFLNHLTVFLQLISVSMWSKNAHLQPLWRCPFSFFERHGIFFHPIQPGSCGQILVLATSWRGIYSVCGSAKSFHSLWEPGTTCLDPIVTGRTFSFCHQHVLCLNTQGHVLSLQSCSLLRHFLSQLKNGETLLIF